MSEPEKEKPKRGPRRDKGARRLSLPAWLVKNLESWAKREEYRGLEDLLAALLAGAQGPEGKEEPITLPPAVQARLAPAAAGSGRSISELLAEMEDALCNLFDGRLWAMEDKPEGWDDDRDGDFDPLVSVPSMEDRLVEAFRARIQAAQTQEREEPSADADELKAAVTAGMERA